MVATNDMFIIVAEATSIDVVVNMVVATNMVVVSSMIITISITMDASMTVAIGKTMAIGMTMAAACVITKVDNKKATVKKWLYMKPSMYGEEGVMKLSVEESSLALAELTASFLSSPNTIAFF